MDQRERNDSDQVAEFDRLPARTHHAVLLEGTVTVTLPDPCVARDSRDPPLRSPRLKRVVLTGTTAFLSINLWTGSPLLALWVGSQAADQQALSMTAVFVVLVTLVALTLAIGLALQWLEQTYRKVAGHPPRENRVTWLRSFNAQQEPVRKVPTSTLERTTTASVYLAVAVFLVWFFVFAGSPLPS